MEKQHSHIIIQILEFSLILHPICWCWLLSGFKIDENYTPPNSRSNTNVSNWDTAYGWGNHASAGYLTSVNQNFSGIVTATSFQGNTTTGDGSDRGFTTKYYITSSGSSAYRFAGPGVLNSTNNPTLYFHRGFTYILENSTGSGLINTPICFKSQQWWFKLCSWGKFPNWISKWYTNINRSI